MVKFCCDHSNLIFSARFQPRRLALCQGSFCPSNIISRFFLCSVNVLSLFERFRPRIFFENQNRSILTDLLFAIVLVLLLLGLNMFVFGHSVQS